MKTLPNPFELNSKLVAYTALAGAALAAPAVAEAIVVSSGPVNINIPSTTAGVYFNVVTGIGAATPAGSPGWDINFYSATLLNTFGSNSTGGNSAALGGLGAYVGTGTTYFNLSVGTVIDSTSSFVSNVGVDTTSPTTPLNLSSSNNYIGFRFFNETTGAVNYGWAQISLAASAGGQPRAIVAYAYENSGAGITIPIPEPSTYALLTTMAAGAVGLRAWRRRKAA